MQINWFNHVFQDQVLCPHDENDIDPLSQPETYEELIELMSIFEPLNVLSYLKSRAGRYRLDKALKTCQESPNASVLREAQAHLLEKDGRIDEAFQLIKSDLVKHLQEAVVVSTR